MEIYLAIWFDRHSDDSYAAFATLENAIAWCIEQQKIYEGRYTFETPSWDWQTVYEYAVDAGDDCPKFYVEKLGLDES